MESITFGGGWNKLKWTHHMDITLEWWPAEHLQRLQEDEHGRRRISPAAHQQSNLHPPGAGCSPQSRVNDRPVPVPAQEGRTQRDLLWLVDSSEVTVVTPSKPNLVPPDWVRVLHQWQDLHDGDEDELAGVVYDGQDGGEVVCATAGRDLRGGALQEAPDTWTNQGGRIRKVVSEVGLVWYFYSSAMWFTTIVLVMMCVWPQNVKKVI